MSDGTVLRGKYDRMVEDRDAWRGAARQADAELAQLKAGWAEDDARLQRAEEGWAEASERLAQVKAERDEWRSDFRELGAKMAQAVSLSQVIEAERDTALRELEVEQAVAAGALHRLDLVVNGEGTFQPTVDAFAEARAFLLSMRGRDE